MEFEHNKRRKRGALCLLILALIGLQLILTACDPKAGEYPYARDSVWICDDPQISLEYRWVDKKGLFSNETMIWDCEDWSLYVEYLASQYWAFADEKEKPEDLLFKGHWTYRRGNLILKIEEDYLFNGQYKELVFTRQKIDPTEQG